MSAPNATTAMLYQNLFTTLMTINYTIFPDGDGVPHLIKLDDDPLTPDEISTLDDNLGKIFFTLYTKRRPQGQVIRINDPGSISSSDWNPDRTTIVSTHGWRSAGDTPACTRVRDAYLKIFDCNVIVIDWSAIAGSFAYPLVAKSVPRVAAYVASFVNFMRLSANLYTNQLKMVGHSLGGHVASLAARIVSQSTLVAEVIEPLDDEIFTYGKLKLSSDDFIQVFLENDLWGGESRIAVRPVVLEISSNKQTLTGDFILYYVELHIRSPALDPAKPMFSDKGPDGRVDRSHAEHVQVVHTNAGTLGLSEAFGTSDFYANGGSSQPGCGWDPLSVCAHQRSYLYYAESVGHPNGFPGTSKTGEVTANMGGPVLDSKAMGYSFDFKTGERDPFSLVPLAG